MLQITNRIAIINILASLDKDKQPSFGLFTPQHMVEHLIFTLEISLGKHQQPLVSKPEQLEPLRAFLYSEKELSFGAKAPFLTDELPPLLCSTMDQAKGELSDALNSFFRYYEEYPSQQHMNPVFGILSKEEWIMFHNKHFTHHFNQFGLV